MTPRSLPRATRSDNLSPRSTTPTPSRVRSWPACRPAPLNIVCFRYAPEGLDDAGADTFNREAVKELQADGRAFVTGTVWHGRASIRAAFDNWATTAHDVAILQDAIADIGRSLSGRYGTGT
jgi:glutamate/tyrosine decarboxylase-like PLP-dependent enzyme